MSPSLEMLTPVESHLPGTPRSVTIARHKLAAFLEGADITSPAAELAVTEAVSNAVTHGFRGRPPGSISLRFDVLAPSTLLVTVADDGIGMSPDPEHKGLGMGLSIMGRLATDLEITSRQWHGTTVTMRFRLDASR